MESKRTLQVLDMSLGGSWYTRCPKDTSRKLHINFQVFTFLESGPTSRFSRVLSKCHPWSLRGRWRFLTGVLVVFDMVDVSSLHQSVIMESKKTVEVPERRLGGF